MNGTEVTTPIKWTKTSTGGWEATIGGVEYLIEWRGIRYYLYRGPEREQIDSNDTLLVLMWIAECL